MPKLDLPPGWLRIVRELLATHVPDAVVWACGSRVSGGSHPGSDLDLALHHPGDLRAEHSGRHRLLDALHESDLPILVEVHDWARLPESFHREIERAHLVVQEPALAGAGPTRS